MAFDLTISDPLKFIADLKDHTKIFQWITLLFQVAVSLMGTFMLACGGALVAKASVPWAIGHGMVWDAIVLAVFTRRSPLLKGMMFVFPSDEARQEIESGIQVIERPK